MILKFTLAFALSFFLLACKPNHLSNKDSLPKLGVARVFELELAQDRKLSSEQLTDQVLLVNFFFTSCPSICPIIMGEMSKVHKNFLDQQNFKMLSISVDPKRDSFEVLNQFSQRLSANANYWYFLRGPKLYVNELISSGFKLVAGEEPDAHSTRIILIDRNYQIRAYFDGLETGVSDKIIKSVNLLLQE